MATPILVNYKCTSTICYGTDPGSNDVLVKLQTNFNYRLSDMGKHAIPVDGKIGKQSLTAYNLIRAAWPNFAKIAPKASSFQQLTGNAFLILQAMISPSAFFNAPLKVSGDTTSGSGGGSSGGSSSGSSGGSSSSSSTGPGTDVAVVDPMAPGGDSSGFTAMVSANRYYIIGAVGLVALGAGAWFMTKPKKGH